MKKETQVKVLIELVRATLELENLKPFVGDSQLNAANRIRNHLNSINNLLLEHIESDDNSVKHSHNPLVI